MTNNTKKEDNKIFIEFHDILRYYAKDREIQGIIKDGNRDRRPNQKGDGGWNIQNLVNFGGGQ